MALEFMRMVEQLRRCGLHGHDSKGEMTSYAPNKISEKLWKQIEVCQPFVFATPLDKNEELLFSNRDNEDIDAHFESCSIEVLGGGHVLTGHYCEETDTAPVRQIRCLFAAETSPRTFDILELIEFPKFGPQVFFVSKQGVYAKMISQYFQRLRREAVGYESVRERLTLGTGKAKRVVRLRKIVHVVPNKLHAGYQEGPGRHVDWSHRWLVRGHWVSLPGRLGKDRNGDYCVQDWTWRSEHEKGPENAPLINKTRFVGSETPKETKKDG